MNDTSEPRYQLCLLSHGRQAAYAFWCHLNEHPQLFLPDFAYTDGLLLEDAPYAPAGPYSAQLVLPRSVPGLATGILVHLFSHLDRLPGELPERLAKRLSPEAVFVLVPRDPVANLRSMYRTQLELFHGRKAFGLELPGHPLYDREAPVGFAEYVGLAAYGVDYGQQLGTCVPPGARTILFDFADLGEDSMGAVLASIVEAMGLDGEPVRGLGRVATNPGSELIHQRLFSFRSRVELEGQRVDFGFFWQGTDPLLRGSFEVELDGPELEGARGVRAYGSTATWFTLPPKTREWLVQGEGWSLVEERWQAYRRYRAEVAERVDAAALTMEEVWSEGGKELEARVIPPARAFREKHPEATVSWGDWDSSDRAVWIRG